MMNNGLLQGRGREETSETRCLSMLRLKVLHRSTMHRGAGCYDDHGDDACCWRGNARARNQAAVPRCRSLKYGRTGPRRMVKGLLEPVRTGLMIGIMTGIMTGARPGRLSCFPQHLS